MYARCDLRPRESGGAAPILGSTWFWSPLPAAKLLLFALELLGFSCGRITRRASGALEDDACKRKHENRNHRHYDQNVEDRVRGYRIPEIFFKSPGSPSTGRLRRCPQPYASPVDQSSQ